MTRKGEKSSHPQDRAWPLFLAGAGLILLGAVAGIWLFQKGLNAGSGAASEQRLKAGAPAQVDFPAPQLELYDLRGVPVNLEDYRGKVVLVNNWATWCPPCREEMPVLQEYFSEHAGKGFVILAIAAGEPPAQIASFVDRYNLTFPVLSDPAQSSTAAFKNYSLPSSYVIDRSGQVRLAWLGPVDRESLDTFLTPQLEY